MAGSFNPYHAWLGIPPEEQPANLYRLLGLRIFESDPDVISNASDQRMAYLRSLQIGKHRSLSQMLLNEVSAATACLMNEAKRNKYDEQLRQEMAQREALIQQEMLPAAPVAAAPASVPPPIALPLAVARPIPAASVMPPVAASVASPAAIDRGFPAVSITRPRQTSPSAQRWVLLTTIAVCMVLSLGIVISVLTNQKQVPRVAQLSKEQQKSEAIPPESPPVPPAELGILPVVPPKQPNAQPVESTSTSPPSARPESFPLPEEAALLTADTWLSDVYLTQIQHARTPQQNIRFAEHLAKDAAAEVDGARVHALLARARQLRATAADVPGALTIVEQLVKTFNLNENAALRWRMTTYKELAESPLATADRAALADRLVAEADDAWHAAEFAAADECSLLGLRVTRSLSEPERKRVAAQQRTKILQLKTELTKYEQAQTVLATDPANPEANQTVGKFLCGALANWEKGRRYLAAGTEPAMLIIIPADRAADEAPAGDFAATLQLAAGDAWFDWAASSKRADTELMALARRRARDWYQTALPKLKGLARTKAEKRLLELPVPAGIAALAVTPSKNDIAAESKPPPKENKPATSPKKNADGLSGLIYVNNAPQSVLLRYQSGNSIAATEFEALLRDLRLPEQRVRIVLEGSVRIAVEGEIEIAVAGGTTSRGVHHLHFRGEKLMSVGDDRFKADKRQIRLAPGVYPLQWELTGGEIGPARLEVRRIGTGDAPILDLEPQKFITLQKQTQAEVELGNSPM